MKVKKDVRINDTKEYPSIFDIQTVSKIKTHKEYTWHLIKPKNEDIAKKIGKLLNAPQNVKPKL